MLEREPVGAENEETQAQLAVSRMIAVGRVDPASVRFWAYLEKPVALWLELSTHGKVLCLASLTPQYSGEGTCAFDYPGDFPAAPPLQPSNTYTFRVFAEDQTAVGEGRFKTPPLEPSAAPERWTFAFMSCHQPFDRDGAATEQALDMLVAAERVLDERDVDLVLFLGDQVYADEPACLSLFRQRRDQPGLLNLPPQEVRYRYHARYEHAWSIPAWQRLHARCATACLPDDHEVIDNFGSESRHCLKQWRMVGNEALDVAFSWQGLRSFDRPNQTPPCFQQAFRWGNAGFFLMDVRSQRRNTGDDDTSQLVDEAQMAALEAFLLASGDLHAVFVAMSVPIVHIPDWVAKVGHSLPLPTSDLDDRWTNPRWRGTRQRLVNLLEQHKRRHPNQRLATLAGDIHAGWAIGLTDPANDSQVVAGAPLYQFVSSAVTNGNSSLVGTVSGLLLQARKYVADTVEGLVISPVKGIPGHQQNPFGGLNVGVVEVQRSSGGASIRFQIVSHGSGEDASAPVVVFDSGRL